MDSKEKYSKFLELKNELDYRGINYQKDLDILMPKIELRESGKQFTIRDHTKGLVFSKLSALQKFSRIEENHDSIVALFHNFNIDYIKATSAETFIDELKKLGCLGLVTRAQIKSLHQNIEVLEKIAEVFGSIDNYYQSVNLLNLICELANPASNYKLRGLGIPLVSEYLRNVGMDIIKPDVHICRILYQWGYCHENYDGKMDEKAFREIYNICFNIAKTFGIRMVEVDTIIWRGGESGVAYRLND